MQGSSPGGFVRRWWRSPAGLNWRAAALLGLVSSTFSTIMSQLTATRIGRDAVVDWMSVATIPLRERMLEIEPSWTTTFVGIAFHQWADFSWAVVFFGLLGRWTAGLTPWTILLVAIPWSVFTSLSEWLFLVPLIPFWQPIFPLEQPYWIGFLVHATSASIYPLFPWIRDALSGRLPSPHRRFTAIWSGLALLGIAAMGTVALFGLQHREWPWMGTDPGYDQAYIRRMMAHHTQGIELAQLGAERAQDPHLQAIARLIAAAQLGENKVFEQWWASWFPDLSDLCTPRERDTMPGMLTPDQMASARQAQPAAFDPLFIKLMSDHHIGAITMADDAMRRAEDPRLRIMAHAIRHEQRGEIQLMHGVSGIPAVRSAIASLFVAAGQHPSDHGLRADEPAGRTQ